MRSILGIFAFTAALAVAPFGAALAHGGGSMPGGSSGMVTATPRNVADAAKSAYNAGVRNIKKAQEYDAEAAKASTPEKAAKAHEKAQKSYHDSLGSFIDAVGAESHATASFDAVLDKAKAAVLLGTDRPHVLRAAIMACRPGGIVSVPGVYGGFLDKVPFGAAMNKGLTIRTGQTHVNRYALDLLRRIEEGQINPSYIITHRARLQDGPGLYETFRDKKDGCIKVVLTP